MEIDAECGIVDVSSAMLTSAKLQPFLTLLERDGVTTLHLSHTSFTLADFLAVFYALKTHTRLTHLNLGFNEFDQTGLQSLVEFVAQNNTLQSLNLNAAVIHLDISALARVLPQTTICELYLPNNNLGPEGACWIAQALSTRCSLKLLDISQNKIEDRGMNALMKALVQNDTLTTLRIQHNRFNTPSIINMVDMLTVNNTLTSLSLCDNGPFIDQNMGRFSQMLRTNTTLTELCLSSCGITDKSIKSLMAALTHNATLTKLYLGGNDFRSYYAIARMIAINTTLRTLDFGTSRWIKNKKVWPSFIKACLVNSTLTEIGFDLFLDSDQLNAHLKANQSWTEEEALVRDRNQPERWAHRLLSPAARYAHLQLWLENDQVPLVPRVLIEMILDYVFGPQKARHTAQF